MWVGSRGPFFFVVHGSTRGRAQRTGKARDEVLAWKKAFNHGVQVEMPDVTAFAQFLDERGAGEFHVITVPPPSFHAADRYPAAILCGAAVALIDKPLTLLWPHRYNKSGKVWTANIRKVYPPPAIDVRGQLVLILDDIATSGNTMAAAMRAVVNAGGYPAGVVYA